MPCMRTSFSHLPRSVSDLVILVMFSALRVCSWFCRLYGGLKNLLRIVPRIMYPSYCRTLPEYTSHRRNDPTARVLLQVGSCERHSTCRSRRRQQTSPDMPREDTRCRLHSDSSASGRRQGCFSQVHPKVQRNRSYPNSSHLLLRASSVGRIRSSWNTRRA